VGEVEDWIVGEGGARGDFDLAPAEPAHKIWLAEDGREVEMRGGIKGERGLVHGSFVVENIVTWVVTSVSRWVRSDVQGSRRRSRDVYFGFGWL
jgi:hypothetical protein